MKTLVISDVHLKPSCEKGYYSFWKCVEQTTFDQLIILGDLFDTWIGDDAAQKQDIWLAEKLSTLKRRCKFIFGNRDFLVGSAFLDQACMDVLHDPLIRIEKWLVYFAHGDEWCTTDARYQEFRKITRNSAWIGNFLNLSIHERKRKAKYFRDQSVSAQNKNVPTHFDVDKFIVKDLFERKKVDLIVHGHTHQPGIHICGSGCRLVNSDWDNNGSGVASIIETSLDKICVSLVHLSPLKPFQILDQVQKSFREDEWKRNIGSKRPINYSSKDTK